MFQLFGSLRSVPFTDYPHFLIANVLISQYVHVRRQYIINSKILFLVMFSIEFEANISFFCISVFKSVLFQLLFFSAQFYKKNPNSKQSLHIVLQTIVVKTTNKNKIKNFTVSQISQKVPATKIKLFLNICLKEYNIMLGRNTISRSF